MPSAGDAARIGEVLRGALGDQIASIVFFGSRYLGTSPSATSACDLFVVVESYDAFYQTPIPGLSRPPKPKSLALLNRILAPNIFSYDDGQGPGAKCFILSTRDFARALGRHSPDQFVKGRLTQSVTVLYARDEERRGWTLSLLDEARRSSLEWVPSFFSREERARPFDVYDFGLRMLKVSYAYEIRPEPAARVREVLDAQRDFFARAYGAILDDAAAAGTLTREGNRYRMTPPPGLATRMRWRAYFRLSKVRATLRWLKYTATFEDWLDYIIRKVERRTGLTVEVTRMERRLPFLLLWPKVFYVLRERKKRGAPATPATKSGHRP